MRNRNVGKVRIDDLYNLIVVVGEFLKLEVKIVQLGDELHFRRVASDDYELFGDNAFDYKMAAVILRSGLAERAVPLSDKGTARCCLATTKIRTGESLTEVFGMPRCDCREQCWSRCNIKPCRRQNKPSVRTGANIGTEVFQSIVSCSMKGRFSYSVHYSDINRMK